MAGPWTAGVIVALLVSSCDTRDPVNVPSHDATGPDPGAVFPPPRGLTRLSAVLSGAQEVPPVAGAATGSATVTVHDSRTLIEVTLNVSNLSDITAAHIHLGKGGVNGPVLLPLATASFTSPLQRGLTAADFTAGTGGLASFADVAQAILEGRTYINVHTTQQPGGAIRGQVGPVALQAVLSGNQEVPAVTTTASGTVTLQINGAQDQIDATVTPSNLTNAAAAHIHVGTPGRNGPVILPLATAPFTGTLTKTLRAADLTPQAGAGVSTFSDAVNAILGGRAYVNVHTTANPGGEIRGQVGAVTLRSVLGGSQEAPTPVTTSATGTAVTTIAPDQASVSVQVEFANLTSSTAAHIHVGRTGQPGGVLLPLATATFTSPLTKTLVASDLTPTGGITTFAQAVDALLSGRAYINLHTTANPGGELRGQVGPVTLTATLNGANERPNPVTTSATGAGTAVIDGDQSSVQVTLSHADLTNITAAHIHAQDAATAGPVILPLASGTFTSPLTKTLTAADLTPQAGRGVNTFADAVNAMLSGLTYFNIHTTANPGGEIRGQITPP
jgi:uncharacterized protein (UPF0548 family)